MKKLITNFFFAFLTIVLVFFAFSAPSASADTLNYKVDCWHLGHCSICGHDRDYDCSPYGTYPGYAEYNFGINDGWESCSFTDPVPSGLTINSVTASIVSLTCNQGDYNYGGTGDIDLKINGTSMGTNNASGNCLCGTCNPLTITTSGAPAGYIYGGTNQMSLDIDAVMCVTEVDLAYDVTCGPGGCLQATCSGAPNPAIQGQNVTYTASVTGGTAPYTYTWSNECSGGGGTCNNTYFTDGTKTAHLTVADANNITTETDCSVNVETPLLQVSCSGAPNPAVTGQTVTFTSTVSGGTGSYSYQWFWDCTGTGANCVTSFSTTGQKSATVKVTSGSQETTATTCTVNLKECDTNADCNVKYPDSTIPNYCADTQNNNQWQGPLAGLQAKLVDAKSVCSNGVCIDDTTDPVLACGPSQLDPTGATFCDPLNNNIMTRLFLRGCTGSSCMNPSSAVGPGGVLQVFPCDHSHNGYATCRNAVPTDGCAAGQCYCPASCYQNVQASKVQSCILPAENGGQPTTAWVPGTERCVIHSWFIMTPHGQAPDLSAASGDWCGVAQDTRYRRCVIEGGAGVCRWLDAGSYIPSDRVCDPEQTGCPSCFPANDPASGSHFSFGLCGSIDSYWECWDCQGAACLHGFVWHNDLPSQNCGNGGPGPGGGGHLACNTSLQCIAVQGAGANSCTTNADCTSNQNQSHSACNFNGQCVSIQGAGTNECTTNADCTSAQTHQSCNSSAQCVEVQGAGVNGCTTDADCDNPQTHYACNSSAQCVQIQGAGVNGCTTDADCIFAQTHFACDSNQQCIQIQGAGVNGCATDADCQGAAESHFACTAASQCEQVQGAGVDGCSTDADCPAVPNTHFACTAASQCEQVDGAGTDDCSTDADCPAVPNTHFACTAEAQCDLVEGEGADGCSTDADCPAVPNIRRTCDVADHCVDVQGDGPDNCSTDADCPTPPNTYSACDSSQECVEVIGDLADTCSSNADCQTHLQCDANQQCIDVQGSGISTCATDADCTNATHLACNGLFQCVPTAGSGINLCATDADCTSHMECNDSRQCVSDPTPGLSECTTDGDCALNPDAEGLDIPDANHCINPPGCGAITFIWTYISPNNVNESQFDFQIDDNADFSSPEVDTFIGGLDNPSGDQNSQTVIVRPISTTPSCGYISYGHTYYWRVKVWDQNDRSSSWVPGPDSFETYPHPFPSPEFTFSGPTAGASSSTASLLAVVEPNAPVSFSDNSVCYDIDETSYLCKTNLDTTYTWTFGDDQSNHTRGNTTHTYITPGTYTVNLNVCDDVGCCNFEEDVEVGDAPVNPGNPLWREINPF